MCKVDNGKVNYVCVHPKVTLGVRTLEVKLVRAEQLFPEVLWCEER